MAIFLLYAGTTFELAPDTVAGDVRSKLTSAGSKPQAIAAGGSLRAAITADPWVVDLPLNGGGTVSVWMGRGATVAVVDAAEQSVEVGIRDRSFRGRA